MKHQLATAGRILALAALAAGSALAQPITFRDVAGPAHGVTYERAPSATAASVDALRARQVMNLYALALAYPLKPYGAAGVALLDYDRDGDLDIYATNGPGRDNSLYANQLAQGVFTFVEVPGAAGAAATGQDSTGVCFGDTDNDGDLDLYVLGRGEPNRFFENRGGSFVDVSGLAGSDIAGGNQNSSSCAMGDVDGDGLLDVFVGNTFDWATKAAIMVEPYVLNEYNQLFVNRGGNRFEDVSASAGLQNVRDISWSATMFDVDADGDVDILVANDQGAIPPGKYGGVDRGFVRIYRNDGNLRFTDVTARAGLRIPGSYMGFAVADLDGDWTLDLYVSNIGDWLEPFIGIPYTLGDQTTRWFLNNGDGTFRDPRISPAVGASGWAWGTSAFDYDNDGDFDLVSYGGLDVGPLIDKSNPGTILVNDGRANFTVDLAALAGAADHGKRDDHALATGDLNDDGFEDIVSISHVDLHHLPLIPYPFGYGTPLDGIAGFIPTWAPTGQGLDFAYTGAPLLPGTLAIEINSGGNGNGWVNVDTLGTRGITTRGRVNRDGIGAVVRFTPAGGRTATQPILGGSSHSSQDSLTAHFGLGKAPRGMVEVTWPGGVRNRLYNVRSGERVTFPEIPCSFDTRQGRRAYETCVKRALSQLVRAGVLDAARSARFQASAMTAYEAAR
jgi:hypothetical protein